MGVGRNFAGDVEAIANEWHLHVLSNHLWTPESPPGKVGGIGEGFYVKDGNLRAFAKPIAPPKHEWGSLHQGNVAACHEKVAADLAHLLHMPVPPVLLWDCKNEQTASVKYRCVSLVPFSPFYTWKQVLAIPGMPRQIIPSITKQASAMVAFDTWLDNRDRMNAGNVLLGMESGSNIVRCAYIDFAQSMSFGWCEGPPPIIVLPVPRFPGSVPLDRPSVDEAIVAIEALPEGVIRNIVERIPGEFTPPKRRASIVDGLLARRGCLRKALLMAPDK